MKQFDIWNIQKKEIHDNKVHLWSRERDIWWCSMGENIGFEQDGKGELYLRPVLVIKNFGLFTALIILLTTSSKENPYHVELGYILNEKAFAIITQIRLIDTRRMAEKIGKLEEGIFIKVKNSIQELLA